MSEETKFIFDELRKEGYPLFIDTEQYCSLLGISISTLGNRLRVGKGLPNYARAGDWKNAKILFNLKDVADFLANQTIQTM